MFCLLAGLGAADDFGRWGMRGYHISVAGSMAWRRVFVTGAAGLRGSGGGAIHSRGQRLLLEVAESCADR